MNLLNIPLPDDLPPDASPAGEVRVCVEADLLPDGTLGRQWLVITDDQLCVLARNGAGTSMQWHRPLTDISEPKTLTFVGGGALEVTADNERQVLVRYTSARLGQFNTVANLLEKWSKGETAEVPEEESNHCPTCGLPLQKGSKVCPVCLPRGRTIKRLAAYYLPVWQLALSLSLLSITLMSTALVMPYLQKPLMDTVFAPKNPLPLDLRIHTFLVLMAIMIGVAILSAGLGIINGRLSALVGNRITHNLRCQLFKHLQYLSIGYFDKRQMGSVISRVNQDIGSLQQFLVSGSQDLLGNLMKVIGLAVMMFVLNWKLALLVIVPTPIVTMISARFWWRIRHITHDFFHRWGKLNAMLTEALNGLRVIKAFAQEPREISRFSTRSNELVDSGISIEFTWSTMFSIISLVFGIGTLLITLFGGLQVVRGILTLGTLVAFTSYAMVFTGPLQALSHLFNWTSRAFAAAERVFEVLDTEPEPHTEEAVEIPPVKGKLEFRDVTFGYERARTALKNLSFTLEPGEMIGLVGHSGAGKSTIINLVCRFYEPQQGEILIDGQRIADLPLDAWRGQIGLVPQDTFLFSGTIADNIAYAQPGATREEIIRSAKVANAHDFIVKKPDGYDMLIGEGGQGLSAGEKQRLAIARAVLHNPRILILDEATSQVDVETEKQIQEAIDRLITGRTTIAIAHRLSTLKNAHRLIVLKNGEVVEIGTHDELLEKEDGEFRRLVTMYQEVSKVRQVGR